MKITILDKASLGLDTPFEILEELGELTSYDATPSELVVERASSADVIIINKVKITKEVLYALKGKLKLVCVFATGYDNIDIAAARECGVAVCNVPGYSTESVALYTVTTALSLYTHLTEYRSYVKDGSYTRSGVPNKLTPVYHEMGGKTWGIIGLGNIGRAVARVATALGASVIAYKRTPVTDYECVSLEELCKRSDIISVHCPLTEDTKELINKERILSMKDGVVLVNEARGAVLNERDVTDGVLNGKIGGFGCDVYSKEPFDISHPYNEIMALDNVILTPHAAWGSYESRKRCAQIIAQNIRSFFDGNSLNRVDK